MNFAAFLAGGDGAKDSHPCIDRGIQQLCVQLNDTPRFAAFRDELKPYAAKVLNTAGDADLSRKRAYLCADWAVRTIAPLAIDVYGKRPDLAERLRSVSQIVDKATSLAARGIAQKATKELQADAAYCAADAAYCAADAAYYVAYYAADAAAAVAVRSKSADFTRRVWDLSLDLLDRLIAAGHDVEKAVAKIAKTEPVA